MEDRAVVLAQPDRAVGGQLGCAQVALLVLDDRQLANAFEERGFVARALVETALDALGRLGAAGLEDPVDELAATDRVDRRDQARGQAVVVRRERAAGRSGCHVIQVARPADAMALGPPRDEPVDLEEPELLEDAGPACSDERRQLVRGAGAVRSQRQDQLPAERRRMAIRVVMGLPAAAAAAWCCAGSESFGCGESRLGPSITGEASRGSPKPLAPGRHSI